MQIFLKLKHWHLFLLTAGTYFTVILAPLIVMHYISITNSDVIPVIIFISFVVRSLWQLTIVRGLHKKLPDGFTMSIGAFLIFFYLHFSYSVLISLVSIISRYVDISYPVIQIYENITMVRLWSWLLNLILGIYFAYVISTLLNTVEHQKRWVSVGDIFLILFYPIGIWWIQPRVNKIFSNEPVFDPNTPLDRNITQ